MRIWKSVAHAVVFLAAAFVPAVATAQVDARMFRYPAVSKDQIAFVYAGDIWLVPKKGGTAVRLSSRCRRFASHQARNEGTR